MYYCRMRTTIELPDPLRARLLALAAERGEKGFSHLVQEAVMRYLAEVDAKPGLIDSAVSAVGTLAPDEADQMEESVRALRARWR